MKINKIEYLINKGSFAESKECSLIHTQLFDAIDSIKWPNGSEYFEIYPEKQGNGVKPIKKKCMSYLEEKGWKLEERLELGSRFKPGPVDAVFTLEEFGKFAIEWETGNISSSHRSLNKMALGLINKALVGGILVIPSRDFYFYLTDRIGNFPEIEPYFPLWKSINAEGILAVVEIEHDKTNNQVQRIPKGTDGRALR